MKPPPMTKETHRLDRYQRGFSVVLTTGLILALAGIGVRLVYINVVYGKRLRETAMQQQRSRSVIPARRGTIFDRQGRIVAISRQKPDVFVDPGRARDHADLAARLAPRLNMDPDIILERIRARAHTRYVVIAREVDEVTASAVRALNDPAVGLTERGVRHYPLGVSMAHIIGIVGRDQHGLEGLELQFDQHLAGHDGRRVTIRDGRRRAMWRSETKSRLPEDGGHLVLTIDAAIQQIAETILETTVTRFEAESGVALVMSAKDGDILAIAGVPTFDPNDPGKTPVAYRRNRAITDAMEPGSTFKPFIVCGALDGGFVSLTERIDTHNGLWRIGSRRITDTRPHDDLDLRGIVTFSSNIGMATIGMRMGPQPLYESIRRFGFGETTGLAFPGEIAGLVRPPDRWTRDSTISASIGYEVAVTPLQLATAFTAIVNDGLLIRPRLVKALLAADGTVLDRWEGPQVVRRAVTPETARRVARDLLVSVVEHGSGKPAKQGGYSVLGKTGTAKLTFRDRPGYEPGQYMGAFIGAAPVDDPEIVVLVTVRRPNKDLGYYGRVVAAPAAGRIIARTLAYMQIPPDRATALAGYAR